MSKAQAKASKAKPSKDLKGKPNQAEKQLYSLFEIVPGKFNENDWNIMMETDDSQDFIWEILDEVVDNAIKRVYGEYLSRMTIPFTINEARKAIIHIIDFVTKENQSDLKEIWSQDQEPEACLTDSWAKGCVQTVVVESTSVDVKDKPETARDFTNVMVASEEKDDTLVKHEYEEEADQLSSLRSDNMYDPATTAVTGATTTLMANVTDDHHQLVSSKKTTPSDKSLRPPLLLATKTKANNNNKTLASTTAATAADTDAKSSSSHTATTKLTSKQQQHAAAGGLGNLIGGGDTSQETSLQQIQVHEMSTNRLMAFEKKKLDESIQKAPIACQSVLKTLLSRPYGLREIGIDASGNIESIAKIDVDKLSYNNLRAKFTIPNESKNFDMKKSRQTSGGLDDLSDGDILNEPNDLDTDVVLEPAAGVVFSILNSTKTGARKPGTNATSKHLNILHKTEGFLQPINKQSAFDEYNMARNEIFGKVKTPAKLRSINSN